LVMKTYAGGAGADKDKGRKPTQADAARVLVFAGDTTYRWVRDEDTQALHHRFWKQVVVWLARQEDGEGHGGGGPGVGRLPLRGEIGFQVGMRGKGGGPEVKGGTYSVEVIAPDGTRKVIKDRDLRRGPSETRGAFADTKVPGVYQVVVNG